MLYLISLNETIHAAIFPQGNILENQTNTTYCVMYWKLMKLKF